MKKLKSFVCLLLSIIMTIQAMGLVLAYASNDYSNHWAKAQIENLLDDGIITGYGDGLIKPDNNITRAEFVTIINKLFSYGNKAETNFDDVNSDAWYADQFLIAKKAGYLTGDQYGNANPQNAITRAEVCVIVSKILNIDNVNKTDFTDDYIIPGWAKGYIGGMSKSGLIMGYPDGSFGYSKNITRAEAFAIINNVIGIESFEATTVKTSAYNKSDDNVTTEETVETTTVKKTSSGGGGGGGSSLSAIEYTVSFDLNYEGATGAPASQTVKNGGKAIKPVAPVRNGYVFTGWFTNTTGIETFDFNSLISSNIVLYAGWVINSEELDSDGDGVNNAIESLFGTNDSLDDTDGDGLSDYVEIYISETDPLLVDTDGNGINDGNEDLDGDGLTNIREIELGTNLAKIDTDLDDISDFDEVTIYMTDPCKFDSDDDGLPDGDELLFGLNPLVQKTDGVTLDSERKFEQNVSEDNISEEILSEDNNAIPALSVVTNGNVNRSISIDKTKSSDFSDSRAIVGTPIDINGADLSDATISFELRDSASLFSVLDTDTEYNANLICYYDENNNVQYLETDYDKTTNTISAKISNEGTYFVMDVKALFNELGLSLPTIASLSSPEIAESVALFDLSEDEDDASNNNSSNYNYAEDLVASDASVSILDSNDSIEEFSVFSIKNLSTDSDVAVASSDTEKITLASSGTMAQADIVFIIDTTGSMSDEINNVKNNVGYFVDTLKEKGISAGLALVEYRDIEVDGYDSTKVHKNGTSNWFYDMNAYKNKIDSALYADGGGDTPECVVDALETARLLDLRASSGKIFILVTDADYKEDNRYGIPSMSAEIELLKNAGVNCSVVTTSYEKDIYYNLYVSTGGIYANIYGDFYNELMALADKIGDDIVGDGYWIYLQGPVPVPVRLNEAPYYGSTVDTDEDGIPDVNELDDVNPTGEVNLDELITKISKGAITDTSYGVVKTYKYKSSPVETDTDFDGIDDTEDILPRDKTFKGIMHYQEDGKNKTCDVDFAMDYRNLIDGDNTNYSQELSKLSILYASDVYDNLYVEFTKGAYGGSDNGVEFGQTLGLKDAQYIAIKSDDYSEDKDDITDFFVGHRNINYNGENNEVIVVSVRGTNGTNSEWSSNFDVGADTTEYYNMTGSHSGWNDKSNHKGFDVAANRVREKLNEYISKYVDSSAQKSILITGHSRGAAIANILGKYYEDNASYQSYVYTFATPNSTTSDNADNYKTIFNIVNEDDIIPYLPISEWGFKNYGITKSISIAKNYENRFGKAEEGTWEWLIGKDYNNDGGTKRTLKAFANISDTREDLYKLDSGSDGKVWENNIGHVTRKGAEDEMVELNKTLENEKLLRFCNTYVVGGGLLYHVEINYCPAYLMQSLSNMTTGKGPLLGHDVKGKYASAKASFVASSGKVIVGGMTHPHMQPTYYLIARNNFEKLS